MGSARIHKPDRKCCKRFGRATERPIDRQQDSMKHTLRVDQSVSEQIAPCTRAKSVSPSHSVYSPAVANVASSLNRTHETTNANKPIAARPMSWAYNC